MKFLNKALKKLQVECSKQKSFLGEIFTVKKNLWSIFTVNYFLLVQLKLSSLNIIPFFVQFD